MKWYDRLMLVGLGAVAIWLILTFAAFGNHIATIDDERRPVPVTITPTTAPPTVVTCVVGGDDNWAARFGVEDRSCT